MARTRLAGWVWVLRVGTAAICLSGCFVSGDESLLPLHHVDSGLDAESSRDVVTTDTTHVADLASGADGSVQDGADLPDARVLPACRDGYDNDGDGYADFPDDPGCSSFEDDSEHGDMVCDNGLDDDGDGHVDAADHGCSGPDDNDERGLAACDNGIDDDEDGAADYPQDADCKSPADTSEHGCRWSEEPTGLTKGLFGVLPLAEDDVWIAGVYGTVLHYDGTLNTVPVGLPADVDLRGGIWGVSDGPLWVIGDGGAIASSTTGWNLVSSPTTVDLRGSIMGRTSDEIWAVGDSGTILKYDGLQWRVEPTATTEALNGLWVPSSGEPYAVGNAGTLLHRDFSRWLLVTVPTDEDLTGVWGSSPVNVWVVGAGGVILHFNGATWAHVESPTDDDLRGIWGTSPADIWAVDQSGTVLHYDGLAWTIAGLLGHLIDMPKAISGTSACDLWIVGKGGKALRRRPAQ